MRQNISQSIGYALLLLISVFSIRISAQPASATVSTPEAIAESVKFVPCKKEERMEAVKSLFFQMGAQESEITIEKFKKDKISNVVVRKQGKSNETIIVGAHYDKTDDGCGAIDNWTGISIVAHLFKSLHQITTEKSYIFVGFDQEEAGLLGSEEMAKAIPKEKRVQYCEMVNFDSFGFTAPMSLQSASSSKMVAAAEKLAKENKFNFIDVDFAGADADSSPFKDRGIPAITMSGLNQDWPKYLHSSNDQVEKINMTSVYLGYRFGLMYIAVLDSSACRQYR